MSWYDDDPSVILSAGPVRVNTSEPDPDFEPRPVGFVASAQTLQTCDPSPAWRAFAGRVLERARPCIADQDPGLWGDQA
jgi:hypothetical protein